MDFAVRVMAEPPSHLVAFELGRVRYVACATPSFLAEHGRPQSVEEVKQLPLITSALTSERLKMAGVQEGRQRHMRVKPRLISPNFYFLRDAILQGLGMGLVPDYMVQAPVARGELEVLPLPPESLEFIATHKYLLHMPSQYQTTAVRTLIEYLQEQESASASR